MKWWFLILTASWLWQVKHIASDSWNHRFSIPGSTYKKLRWFKNCWKQCSGPVLVIISTPFLSVNCNKGQHLHFFMFSLVTEIELSFKQNNSTSQDFVLNHPVRGIVYWCFSFLKKQTIFLLKRRTIMYLISSLIFEILLKMVYRHVITHRCL